MDRFKLWLVKWTPWWVLQAFWRSGLVERTTVFRWEMNVALGEWADADPVRRGQ